MHIESSDTNSLLYFYSSVAQSMAALFAISGIFLIFRIEVVKSEISKGIDNFRKWVAFRISIVDPAINALGINKEPHSWLDKDVLDHIEESLDNARKNVPAYEKALTDYFIFIKSRLDYQVLLKKYAFPPFVVISVIFFDALCFLPKMTLLISEYPAILCVNTIAILSLIFCLLVYLIVFIFFVIREPKNFIINTPRTNR